MTYKMKVEQTSAYKKRMRYDPKTDSFTETDGDSLGAVRNFTKPYGWITGFGTPPDPHYDVILMSDTRYELGDEVEIKVIGVFVRCDGDNKYIAVEIGRDTDDYTNLSDDEKAELSRLYPRVGEGEGWYGREDALRIMAGNTQSL